MTMPASSSSNAAVSPGSGGETRGSGSAPSTAIPKPSAESGQRKTIAKPQEQFAQKKETIRPGEKIASAEGHQPDVRLTSLVQARIFEQLLEYDSISQRLTGETSEIALPIRDKMVSELVKVLRERVKNKENNLTKEQQRIYDDYDKKSEEASKKGKPRPKEPEGYFDGKYKDIFYDVNEIVLALNAIDSTLIQYAASVGLELNQGKATTSPDTRVAAGTEEIKLNQTQGHLFWKRLREVYADLHINPPLESVTADFTQGDLEQAYNFPRSEKAGFAGWEVKEKTQTLKQMQELRGEMLTALGLEPESADYLFSLRLDTAAFDPKSTEDRSQLAYYGEVVANVRNILKVEHNADSFYDPSHPIDESTKIHILLKAFEQAGADQLNKLGMAIIAEKQTGIATETDVTVLPKVAEKLRSGKTAAETATTEADNKIKLETQREAQMSEAETTLKTLEAGENTAGSIAEATAKSSDASNEYNVLSRRKTALETILDTQNKALEAAVKTHESETAKNDSSEDGQKRIAQTQKAIETANSAVTETQNKLDKIDQAEIKKDQAQEQLNRRRAERTRILGILGIPDTNNVDFATVTEKIQEQAKNVASAKLESAELTGVTPAEEKEAILVNKLYTVITHDFNDIIYEIVTGADRATLIELSGYDTATGNTDSQKGYLAILKHLFDQDSSNVISQGEMKMMLSSFELANQLARFYNVTLTTPATKENEGQILSQLLPQIRIHGRLQAAEFFQDLLRNRAEAARNGNWLDLSEKPPAPITPATTAASTEQAPPPSHEASATTPASVTITTLDEVLKLFPVDVPDSLTDRETRQARSQENVIALHDPARNRLYYVLLPKNPSDKKEIIRVEIPDAAKGESGPNKFDVSYEKTSWQEIFAENEKYDPQSEAAIKKAVLEFVNGLTPEQKSQFFVGLESQITLPDGRVLITYIDENGQFLVRK